MLRAVIALTFALVFANAQAQEDVKVEKAPEKQAIVVEDSSEYHRMDKQFNIDIQLLGFGPSYVSAAGLQAGYFLNRNMLVYAEFLTGKDDSDRWVDSDIALSSYELKARSFGVHFKHFVGNSFYYHIGLDHRQLEYEFTTSGNVAEFKGKSFGATFAIGNQWQWKNFNLGCDWVGMTVPFGDSFSNESFASGSGLYTRSDFEDHKDVLVKDVNLNLLRFYLGAAF